MIYDTHDFTHNFINASGSDQDGAMNILTGEIINLLIKDRNGLIKVLADSGSRVKPQMTNGEIINLISIELFDNPEFSQHLAKLIAKSGEFHGADAQTESNAPGFSGGGMVGAIAGAVGSVANIFAQGQTKKNTQEQTKQMLIAQLMANQNPKPKVSNGVVLGIVAGSLVLIGIIAFAAIKLRKK